MDVNMASIRFIIVHILIVILFQKLRMHITGKIYKCSKF